MAGKVEMRAGQPTVVVAYSRAPHILVDQEAESRGNRHSDSFPLFSLLFNSRFQFMGW